MHIDYRLPFVTHIDWNALRPIPRLYLILMASYWRKLLVISCGLRWFLNRSAIKIPLEVIIIITVFYDVILDKQIRSNQTIKYGVEFLGTHWVVVQTHPALRRLIISRVQFVACAKFWSDEVLWVFTPRWPLTSGRRYRLFARHFQYMNITATTTAKPRQQPHEYLQHFSSSRFSCADFSTFGSQWMKILRWW